MHAGGKAAAARPRIARPAWEDVLLVCGKCLKRHPDAKAMRHAIKAEVRLTSDGFAKRRRVRIIKTTCLGLCPRRAIAVASATTLAAGEIMLLRDPAEVPEAIARLCPNVPRRASLVRPCERSETIRADDAET